MKFFRRPASLPIICAVLGLLGMGLRFWLLETAVDEKGLLTSHPANIGTLLVCLLAAGAVMLVTLGRGDSKKASGMFPASIPGALSTVVAAVAMALTGVTCLRESTGYLLRIAGVAGILGGVSCLLLALCRFKGFRAHWLLRGVVCVFFMFHLLQHYQAWFSQPQLWAYIYDLLAHVALMATAYQRLALDLGMDGRKAYIATSQLTGVLCLLALPGSGETFFLAAMAAWMFLDAGKLRLPRAKAPATQEEG